jgi:TPR repeat protein
LQDYATARQWFEKAAAKGDEEAQTYLGWLYEYGKGVPQDFVQAHKWYNLAAAKGEMAGAVGRDELAMRMTPAQIAEAHKLAREWRPKTP